jgi:hypothetical protein
MYESCLFQQIVFYFATSLPLCYQCADTLQVQLAAVQNSGQFVDSGAGKVRARTRRLFLPSATNFFKPVPIFVTSVT